MLPDEDDLYKLQVPQDFARFAATRSILPVGQFLFLFLLVLQFGLSAELCTVSEASGHLQVFGHP